MGHDEWENDEWDNDEWGRVYQYCTSERNNMHVEDHNSADLQHPMHFHIETRNSLFVHRKVVYSCPKYMG